MIRDLFINFCLLSTFLFFGDMARNMLQARFALKPKLLNQLSGIVLGFFGVLQMLFTFELPNGILLDFRQLSIMAAAFIGGPWIALLASVVMGAGRLLIAGGLTPESLFGLAAIMLMYLVTLPAFLVKGSFERKWFFTTLGATVLVCVLLLYGLGTSDIPLVLALSMIQAAGCVFTYLMLRYLRMTREMQEALKREIEHDFLTGLYNSRGFETRYRLAAASNSPFALLLIDIDHFKQVNDTYGHPAGDAVLKQLGKIIRNSVRKTGYASRKGGEEFAVILPCDAKQAVDFAENLRGQIEQSPFLLPDGRIINVTISVGIGLSSRFSETELFEQTDRALYRAKQEGRNRGIMAV
ncbi:GGDEF domain-containing protein [Saccharibacillus kuerlensis]|uniref:GGDEF domain-containing protein n=1 Tax=Saccharibacillus kuerlensis TaxID=459527 RepID=A0ABQ2L7J5_9BACL|nr:diguanylate cyclase [Saccharibacillus kuerlensis]GGO06086.1 GGDEF domain-containing protein [Saccharibacillus kuerlensis]